MFIRTYIQFIFLSLVSKPSSSMLQEEYFLKLSGLRIRSPGSFSFSFPKETQCCLRCLQYTECQSVNFDSQEKRCEINFLGLQSEGAKTEVNQSWVLYYKPFVKERELMLRAAAGSGISVRDTWLGTIEPHPAEDTCISMATGACSTYYRNPKVDLWTDLPINQVILELYKAGTRVMFMVFNGTDSNIENWMSSSRLLSSSWATLSPYRHFIYFSLTGDSPCSRVFLIQQNYGGCPKDAGWFVVLDPTTSDCCPGQWSDLPNKPQFVYSLLDNVTTYQGGDVDYADVMALYVKYR